MRRFPRCSPCSHRWAPVVTHDIITGRTRKSQEGPGSAMATMRSTWGPHDVKALVRAVGSSPQLPALMSSTTAPNAAAWQGVIAAMGACGRGRTTAQVRAKWKAVKAAFHHERAHRLSTGQPSSTPPPHYRRLLRLWLRAGRPAFRERRYTAAMMGGQRQQERPRRPRQPLPEVEEVEEEEAAAEEEEEVEDVEVHAETEEAVAVEEVEEHEHQQQQQQEVEDVLPLPSPDMAEEVLDPAMPPARQDTVDREVQTSPVPVYSISVGINTEPLEDATALREEVLQLQARVAHLTQMLEVRDMQVTVQERVLERHEHHVHILHEETANLHVALQEHLATIRWLQGLLDRNARHL